MEEKEEERRYSTFYPDQFFIEAIVFLLVMGAVLTMAVLLPVGYEEEANSLITPSNIKPEWYFLWLYQIMKMVPPLIGVVVPFILSVALILLPFIDTKEIKSIRDRLWVILGGTIIFTILFILSIWGALGK